MLSIIECIDEFYSENLGEEVTRGMRESAARGFHLSSRPPYGYRKVKMSDGGKERTKLDIDESQSQVVASVFDQVINGKGLTEITRGLNLKGIASPTGTTWGKTSLHKMLGNEVYAGTIVWGTTASGACRQSAWRMLALLSRLRNVSATTKPSGSKIVHQHTS